MEELLTGLEELLAGLEELLAGLEELLAGLEELLAGLEELLSTGISSPSEASASWEELLCEELMGFDELL